MARIRWEDPDVGPESGASRSSQSGGPSRRSGAPSATASQPPQALVPLPRVYGYESRKNRTYQVHAFGLSRVSRGREVRRETQAAMCCLLKVALTQWRCAAAEVGSSTRRTLRHRNGTPVLRHIGSLAHLTAGSDSMLADTGGFRLLCPQQWS